MAQELGLGVGQYLGPTDAANAQPHLSPATSDNAEGGTGGIRKDFPWPIKDRRLYRAYLQTP